MINPFRSVYRYALLLLGLAVCVSRGRMVDDFSDSAWSRFESTPGSLSQEPGALQLLDAPEPPTWVTASRTWSVDVDRTPWCLVMVHSLTDRGTVKLIRKEPYDKRVALQIDRPGLYAVNMRETFGWSGSSQIEVCLYAIGDEARIHYSYVAMAEGLTESDQARIDERKAGGNVTLKVEPFELVPLFHSCSVYFSSAERPDVTLQFRKAGSPWQPAFPLVYVAEDEMYRGSLVNLEENTRYDVRIVGENGTLAGPRAITTWETDVPIAKTVMLNQETFEETLRITEHGTPDGWIRVTAPPGHVLRLDGAPLIELRGARYVIVEGLTLRGGLQEVISITDCRYVRIVNCDIAGWGRLGSQRFDRDGKFYTQEGRAVNWDSAILVRRSLGTVVERCYIHDPVTTANPWYYSHPAGPQAVGIDKPRSTVLRYNDFIGSDLHRWNDGVEGAGNFHIDGGFNRDADIYGNMICFANDDALEIDGGQVNVRVFRNKFEGCLCGVSIQGCMSGPSYVFENLLVNMGDERGVGGQTIKTSSYANGRDAVSFIVNNTCYGDSSDLRLVHNLRIVAKNNIFAGRSAIRGRDQSPQSVCDANLRPTGDPDDEPNGIVADPQFVDPAAGLFALRHTSPAIAAGLALHNLSPQPDGKVDMGALPAHGDDVLPARPIPLYLDRYQITFASEDSAKGTPATVGATCRKPDAALRFRIAKNHAFDWFTVTPEKGSISADEGPVRFTVKPIPEKLTSRRLYRGAFLIRLENGFSRPVMVYARTDATPPVRPSRDGVFVTYIEAETPTSATDVHRVEDGSASAGNGILLAPADNQHVLTYTVNVPAEGIYFLAVRVRSDEPVGAHNSLLFSIDDATPERAQLYSDTAWTWSLAAHNRSQGLTCLQPLKLSAGTHTVNLAPREAIYVDLLAITDNPKLFE